MKTSKIKKELKEVEYDIKYHCDWCDKDVENDNLYEINDFSLDQNRAENCYPDGGGNGVEKTVDLCLGCQDKLFELLQTQGVKIQVREWDC